MKRSPYQKSWWDERVFKLEVYISRNDLAITGVVVVLVILFFVFVPNMDWVFGLRSK